MSDTKQKIRTQRESRANPKNQYQKSSSIETQMKVKPESHESENDIRNDDLQDSSKIAIQFESKVSQSLSRVEKALDELQRIFKETPPSINLARTLGKENIERLYKDAAKSLEDLRLAVIKEGINEKTPLCVSLGKSNNEKGQTVELVQGYAPYKRADGKPNITPDKENEIAEEDGSQFTRSSEYGLRGRVWKCLILGPVEVMKYQRLTELFKSDNPEAELAKSAEDIFAGLPHCVTSENYQEYCRPCEQYSVTRDDSFRTFRTNASFTKIVPEQSIVRMSNAFVHFQSESKVRSVESESDEAWVWKYTQGLNLYAGLFLYVLPELDAFQVFSVFCGHFTPLYWHWNHIGVQAGCYLVDRILEQLDKPLYDHLLKHNIRGLIYAFPSIKSMLASIEPLDEAIKLWDFFFAMGPHMSILCLVAQLESLRTIIMESDYPKAILDYRHWPPLDAEVLKKRSLELLDKLSPSTEQDLLSFALSINCAAGLTGRKSEAGFQSLQNKK